MHSDLWLPPPAVCHLQYRSVSVLSLRAENGLIDWKVISLFTFTMLQKLIPVSLIPRLTPAQQCKVKVKSVSLGTRLNP